MRAFTALFLLQMDQPRRDHLQVSFPTTAASPPHGTEAPSPSPAPQSSVGGCRAVSDPACAPLGSSVSWPRSQEAPGRTCVTSSQSLTLISLQAPLSLSSPKSYWARENEGRPQLRAHGNTAPPSTHSPHLPWPGTLLSFPAPSLLSRVDGPRDDLAREQKAEMGM